MQKAFLLIFSFVLLFYGCTTGKSNEEIEERDKYFKKNISELKKLVKSFDRRADIQFVINDYRNKSDRDMDFHTAFTTLRFDYNCTPDELRQIQEERVPPKLMDRLFSEARKLQERGRETSQYIDDLVAEYRRDPEVVIARLRKSDDKDQKETREKEGRESQKKAAIELEEKEEREFTIKVSGEDRKKRLASFLKFGTLSRNDSLKKAEQLLGKPDDRMNLKEAKSILYKRGSDYQHQIGICTLVKTGRLLGIDLHTTGAKETLNSLGITDEYIQFLGRSKDDVVSWLGAPDGRDLSQESKYLPQKIKYHFYKNGALAGDVDFLYGEDKTISDIRIIWY